ncbi:hypothetical protein GOBAR_AA18411 [Gossypium barbadense]|uniref:Uncharacterized protein n=1 Tax=Gossypium barbadense TaxID=3634 RepID=A0A2P5XFZ8_GOSBA|nr:hypothetical protein GOBAR_AA18411 [Gossypium barbadense]
MVSKGKGEVDHNDQKPVSKEYKPRVSYPNATSKDCTEENLGNKFEEPTRAVFKQITGPIYEERRLQIKELDELNVVPNQLKVGDKVLLDAADPRIATSEPNEEIPLTVPSIFPYGTVEVMHPKFGTFKVSNTHLKPYVDKIDSRDEECKLLAPP